MSIGGVPPPPLLPSPPGRTHLVIPARLDPLGRTGPTRAAANGSKWRRTSHGFYVGADVERVPEQRVLEAAAMLPGHGAVTGWGGLLWWRPNQWLAGLAADGRTPLPVSLAVGGENVRSQPDVEISKERLSPLDVVVLDGVRITSPVRSTCFEMRYATSARDAARFLSMAAFNDAVSIAEMIEYAIRHPGWTGIPRCREALGLAEENCWSPPEVDMVLIWRLDADLPRPMCNRPVFDERGRHVGTPDLLDVEAGVVGEYDGSLHLRGAQRGRDVDREEAFRRVGLEYFTVLSSHLREPRTLAQRMRDVRARSAAAAAQRRWTVTPPAGWVCTHSVDLRRRLTPYERSRFLRYRAA